MPTNINHLRLCGWTHDPITDEWTDPANGELLTPAAAVERYDQREAARAQKIATLEKAGWKKCTVITGHGLTAEKQIMWRSPDKTKFSTLTNAYLTVITQKASFAEPALTKSPFEGGFRGML